LATWALFWLADIMQQTTGKSHIDYDAYMSFSSVAALEKSGVLASKKKIPGMLPMATRMLY